MKHTRESIIALISECRKNGKRIDLYGQDLSGLNLQDVDLQDADLRGANLDYCGIEMSCKTIGLKTDKRLISQLLYHMCRMDVQDCPEWDELRNDERVIALANQSHVIPVHGLPGIKPLKAMEEK